MLEFWYSSRCTKHIQLMVSICSCIMTYIASTVVSLSTFKSIACLIFGISLHLLYMLLQRLGDKHRAREGYSILSLAIVVIGMMWIASLLREHWALMLQGFGFMMIGFVLVSMRTQRAKQPEE